LRSRPLVPPIPATMPRSVVFVIQIWIDNNMLGFETADKQSWDPALRVRFHQWLYLYKKVHVRETAMRNRAPQLDSESDRLLRAARALDAERGRLGLSVSRFIKHLKENDPHIVRRQRRTSIPD
jgi:hypothetical protein